jgi:hypothetical protein
MRLLVFSLFIAAAAAQSINSGANPAQSANPTQPGDPPKKARLEGSVVSLTSEAIPRATLRLQGTPSQAGQLATGMTATADDAGKFVFQEVPPGANYQLTVQRPGYIPARYGARSTNAPGAPLSLGEGQILKGLTITMTPQGVISGKVTDRNNDPIQGALVLAMRSGYQRGVRMLVPGSTSQTNDQGEFRIPNLAPGRYYLAVADRRGGDTAANGAAPAEGNVTTFYPNATDAQGAVPLNVTPGSELRGIDVKMRGGRLFSVRGKAVNLNTGAPAGGLIINAIAKQQDTAQPLGILAQLTGGNAQSATDGTFEMRNLTSGSWNLHAVGGVSVNGAATPKLSGQVNVQVGDTDVTGVLLQLGTGVTVTGSVRLEDGDIKTVFPTLSQSGANVGQVIVADAGGLILLGGRPAVSLSEIVLSGGAPPPGQLNEDGTFKIEGINFGKFALNMNQLPQGYYVKSVRFGGTDVTHAALDFTSGAGGSLDILLSNKSSDISGSVRSEKNDSVTGLMIALWTKDPELGSATNGVKTAYTDQNGSFQFKSLAPGEYYVAAWEDADAQQVQNRDLLAMFSDNDAKIKLGEGSKQSTEAKLITSEKLAAAVAKLP